MSDELSDIQRQASDPEQSVWLSAHAGTGKTKVLVDRILRLLLSGVRPGSILAMTYTKAAAAEMQLRIRREVAEWSALPDEELREKIEKKCQKNPSQNEIERARGLLILLTESRETLQIVTIHGFCQSLLMRFPIEAGLSAAPQVIDERDAAALVAQARATLFSQIDAGHADSEVVEALQRLALSLGDGGIDSVMDALTKDAQEMLVFLEQRNGLEHYRNALRAGLGLTDAFDQEAWIQRAPIVHSEFPAMIEALNTGTKMDVTLATALIAWQQSDRDNNDALNAYLKAYLTAEHKKRAKIITDGIKQAHPKIAEVLEREQDWAYACKQAMLNEEVASLSEAVMTLGSVLLDIYRSLKSERGWLDFNDVITAATHLLLRPGYSEWVLSKLDWQIEHVLLDEAQDTSPPQWRLMRILVEELFVPELYEHSPRTLFVVGDKKQSIYRFQGADPEGFRRHELAFGEWFEQTQQLFVSLTLQQSFRSTQAVLSLVDAVCALPVMHNAIDENDMVHEVFRDQHRGCVALWPLLSPPEKQTLLAPWDVTAPDYTEQNVKQVLAEQLADDMAARIKDGAAKPADMMVLVQRRTGNFIETLSRELQRRGVPVAGADRLKLAEHLGIKDIFILAEWCLQSGDDLALATILKGPLFNWDEEQLFDLAYDRGSQRLWQTLQHKSEHADIVLLLNAMRNEVLHKTPYEWLCYVLDECKMQQALRSQFGGELNDLLAELKRQALQFESQHIANLQSFMAWIQQSDQSIKRDMEQGQNAVRIMTVHGAKGLQAPIVYLPDTVNVPKSKNTLLWHVANDMPVAYVTPQGQKASEVIGAIKQAHIDAEIDEYYRLLYVALTRAQDELIIMGHETRETTKDNCWYRLIEEAMRQLNVEPDSDGVFRLQTGSKLRLPSQMTDQTSVDLPSWLHAPVNAPTQALREVLSPSQLVKYDHANDSELLDGLGRMRGNITHALLQMMPKQGLTQQQLLKAARQLEPDYPYAEEAVQEVLAVYHEHGWLFVPPSYAEMTLQGEVLYMEKPIYLRGQIDRLIIEPQRLMIIDYKSNREVPEAMPETYAVQLSAYSALLRPLYPQHKIEAGLLWTKTNQMQSLEGAVLETLCKVSPRNLDSTAA